ncbi:RseA family anti-sigma factor [Pseudoalteromonas agarivorans]|jgi:sigma-E factor negative regulatory protein RseA|uniref:sigma-E factor negative regulatory protein n=1 Tax=Pseudoalteromonas TaxID=53246 RepID=UPI0006D66186|nr:MULTISPECIES: RseA family anti-sigma factor [Pseudoalteromonas]KAA8597005.1 Sigma factor RpoE negative regulatory protein RseA [Vibrio cyclitrophicus]AZN33475.1 metal ABC transporter ATP-binding protein [Pseudoalteromonas sp. Xi13]KPZ56741.1 Anti-sigma-E factor RseA [Pseudoalteromonas sp. P1-13-1a]MCQ8820806.1 RseA family anti-sigma factor [Pseudoalteromonas agarivorans]MCQ8884900.1 RseA family anti-sigma factor [Pseudoalteromonas agarivorans]|tara:strand:- start:309 stop:935 length:627 start_codon:yes stop_codon:yes gene_type:complete
MTKAHVNKLDSETLSALLDGEQHLAEGKISDQDVATFGRYALIGDAMRAQKNNNDIHIDISDNIALALESEPVYADFTQSTANKTPDTEHSEAQQDNKVVAFNWRKPVAQLAIAASVAMFAIVGVNTLPQGAGEQESEIPLLQTTPLTGMASPVSYSSEPALENAEQGLRELQQQRIGALVLEHQRQARVAHSLQTAQNSDKAQEEKN